MNMPGITGLFHVAVKTADLAGTRRFYTGVIGLSEVPRPDFGYPGAWLAVPGPGGAAILNGYAGGPARDNDGSRPVGSGAIDHVSLNASGYRACAQRFEAAGLPWREFIVPGTNHWQLFVHEPNGVQLELTFDALAEGGAPPQIPEHLRYRAGESFFEPQVFVR